MSDLTANVIEARPIFVDMTFCRLILRPFTCCAFDSAVSQEAEESCQMSPEVVLCKTWPCHLWTQLAELRLNTPLSLPVWSSDCFHLFLVIPLCLHTSCVKRSSLLVSLPVFPTGSGFLFSLFSNLAGFGDLLTPCPVSVDYILL